MTTDKKKRRAFDLEELLLIKAYLEGGLSLAQISERADIDRDSGTLTSYFIRAYGGVDVFCEKHGFRYAGKTRKKREPKSSLKERILDLEERIKRLEAKFSEKPKSRVLERQEDIFGGERNGS